MGHQDPVAPGWTSRVHVLLSLAGVLAVRVTANKSQAQPSATFFLQSSLKPPAEMTTRITKFNWQKAALLDTSHTYLSFPSTFLSHVLFLCFPYHLYHPTLGQHLKTHTASALTSHLAFLHLRVFNGSRPLIHVKVGKHFNSSSSTG